MYFNRVERTRENFMNHSFCLGNWILLLTKNNEALLMVREPWFLHCETGLGSDFTACPLFLILKRRMLLT